MSRLLCTVFLALLGAVSIRAQQTPSTVVTIPQSPTPRVNPTQRSGPAPGPVVRQPPVQALPVHPPALLHCEGGDFYNPLTHLCCMNTIQPILGPPQFAECCNGEVIDNRTEKCCMNHEVAHYGQDCCATEAYDLGTSEQCCGERYLYDMRTDQCCKGYVSPIEDHVCCDRGPLRVKGGATQAACCGCGTMKLGVEFCCGGKPVAIKSEKEACCGGETVYDPSLAVCCKTESGEMQVTQGQTCQSATGSYYVSSQQAPTGVPPPRLPRQ